MGPGHLKTDTSKAGCIGQYDLLFANESVWLIAMDHAVKRPVELQAGLGVGFGAQLFDQPVSLIAPVSVRIRAGRQQQQG